MSVQLNASAALPVVSTESDVGWAPEPVCTRYWRGKFPAPARNQTRMSRS